MSELAFQSFKEQGQLVLAKAQTLMVLDQEDYESVSDFAVGCQTAIKKIEDERKTAKKPFLDECTRIDSLAKEMKEPFEQAKKIAQDECLKFMRIQEERRRAAEQKAREEAEAERKRLAEEAAKMADKAATAETTGEKIIAQAKAIEIKEQIQQVAPVVEIVDIPKSSAAISVKTKFVCNVIDMGAFVQFAAKNPEFVDFLKVDLPALNRYVNATKGRQTIDGIEFQAKSSVSTRAKREKKPEVVSEQ